LNILLVNRWYPPYSGFGGVAQYNYYLAHALVERGNFVRVISTRQSVDVPEWQDDNGVIVYRLLTKHHSRLRRIPILGYYLRVIEQYIYSHQVAEKIIELDRQAKADVVEFAEVNAEGFHYLHQPKHRPVVILCHTPTFVLQKHYFSYEMNYDVRLISAMEKYCILNADQVTAPSHDMARVISICFSKGTKTIQVVPNPLDTNLFSPPSRAVSKKNVKILHVGRMERVKGIEVLIKAIPEVLARVPSAQFIFAGDCSDEYKKSLRKQLTNENVKNEQAIFMGSVGQDQIISLYQESDIAVVPTLNYESFSYTCAQAMACGLPLVASRVGGIPETVGSEGAAFLVEPGNPQELASAIITLCIDSSLRAAMGRSGRKRAEKYFSADVVADQIVNIFSSLI